MLCIQPISIRGIVAAAQFKIIQCMLTNGIGISGLTVGGIIRKKNILIHEELPGKSKNATFHPQHFFFPCIGADGSFPCGGMLGCIPKCGTIPASVLFCKVLE